MSTFFLLNQDLFIISEGQGRHMRANENGTARTFYWIRSESI